MRARLQLENGPECPGHLAWIWALYLDFARGRSQGLAGMSFTWENLDAWARRRKLDLDLDQYTIDLLLELETAQAKDHKTDD